jgi:hypothetical protein
MSAPVEAEIINAETVFAPLFATKRKCPLGSPTTPSAAIPDKKGAPGTGVKAPVAGLIWYAETSFEMPLAE